MAKHELSAKSPFEGLSFALGASLIAKPTHQLWLDNQYTPRVRIHHICDPEGVVLASFAKISEALEWCLDQGIRYLVCHTGGQTLLLAVHHLAALRKEPEK